MFEILLIQILKKKKKAIDFGTESLVFINNGGFRIKPFL